MEADPRIKPLSDPLSVPVFNLLVYVTSNDEGVVARVANLPDLVCTASSEPLALKQLIEQAKKRLGEAQASGEKIAWETSPQPPGEQESERYVALHL